MSDFKPGYRHDPATGKIIYAYWERVPSWFGLQDPRTWNVDMRLVAGFFAGAFMLGIIGGFFGAGIPLAFLGGIGTVVYQMVQIGNDGPSKAVQPLTAKPWDGRIVIDFPVELRISGNGEVELAREWVSMHPQSQRRSPTRFDLYSVRSIERRPYRELESETAAEFDPASQFRPTAQRMHNQRAFELRNIEGVIFVFANGQELSVAWKQSSNAAAALHAELREFITEAKVKIQETQKRAAHAAAIDPDDEAL